MPIQPRKSRKVCRWFVCAILAFAQTEAVFGQDEARLAEIESELKIKAKEIELIKQAWPALAGGKAGLLKFDASSGGYPIGVWKQIYLQIEAGAQKVCEELSVQAAGSQPLASALSSGLVIVPESELVNLQLYTIAKAELAHLEGQLHVLDERVNSNIGANIAVAPAVIAVQAFAVATSFLKAFNWDRTLYSSDVAVEDKWLSSLVGKCMHVADLILPNRKSFVIAGYVAQSKFDQHVRKLSALRYSTEIEYRQQPEAAQKNAAAVFSSVDKYVAELNGSKNLSPMAGVLFGEFVSEQLQMGRGLLVLSIVQQGGFSMISSSAWRSDRLHVGGGAIVAYELFDAAGHPVSSKLFPQVDPNLTIVPLE